MFTPPVIQTCPPAITLPTDLPSHFQHPKIRHDHVYSTVNIHSPPSPPIDAGLAARVPINLHDAKWSEA